MRPRSASASSTPSACARRTSSATGFERGRTEARCAGSGRVTAIPRRGTRRREVCGGSSSCRPPRRGGRSRARGGGRRRPAAASTRRASSPPSRRRAAWGAFSVPRRGVEGAAPIRSYLGADPAVAKERKRAAAEAPLPRSRWSAQSPAPRRCRLQPEWKSARARRADRTRAAADRGKLLANVLGRDHSSTPSSASSRRLIATPVAPYPPIPWAAHDAVAGDDESERVLRADGARRPGRPRPTRERSELPVRDDRPAELRRQGVHDPTLSGVAHVRSRATSAKDTSSPFRKARTLERSSSLTGVDTVSGSLPKRKSFASTTPSRLHTAPTPHPGTA